MVYQVYKLEIDRPSDPEGKLEKHVALFVQTGENRAGEMFHIIEDEAKTTQSTVYFKYDRQALRDLSLFSSICKDTKIGQIAEKDLTKLIKICERMPAVISPQTQIKPNCVSWFNNVLLELNRDGVVEFERGFLLPGGMEQLQALGSTARE